MDRAGPHPRGPEWAAFQGSGSKPWLWTSRGRVFSEPDVKRPRGAGLLFLCVIARSATTITPTARLRPRQQHLWHGALNNAADPNAQHPDRCPQERPPTKARWLLVGRLVGWSLTHAAALRPPPAGPLARRLLSRAQSPSEGAACSATAIAATVRPLRPCVSIQPLWEARESPLLGVSRCARFGEPPHAATRPGGS